MRITITKTYEYAYTRNYTRFVNCRKFVTIVTFNCVRVDAHKNVCGSVGHLNSNAER